MSTTVLWIGAAGVAAAIFAVWVVAYQNGRSKADREFRRDYGVISRAPSDPLNVPEGATPQPSPEVRKASGPTASRDSGPETRTDPSQGVTPVGSGRYITLQGFVEQDPRQEGWNYLVLGQLSREDAWAAMQFFAKNGIETFAVLPEPVDRKGPRPNNPPRFQLFAAQGVRSKEFAGRQLERDRLKQEVVRLGAVWKKEHKGSSSFADPFWLKN